MINKKFTFILLFFVTQFFYAQVVTLPDTVKISQPKFSYLDSIKGSFVNYKSCDKTDDLWAKELCNLDLYNDLIKDIETINPDTPVDYELSTEVFKERLRLLDEKSAFNIEYNGTNL